MSPECSHGNMKIDYRCIKKRRQRDIKEGRGTGGETLRQTKLIKSGSKFFRQDARKRTERYQNKHI